MRTVYVPGRTRGPEVPPAHRIMFSNTEASGHRRFHANVLRPALLAPRGGGGRRGGPSSPGGVSSPRASDLVVVSGVPPARRMLSFRAVLILSPRTESAATVGSWLLVKLRITLPCASRKSIVTTWRGCASQ